MQRMEQQDQEFEESVKQVGRTDLTPRSPRDLDLSGHLIYTFGHFWHASEGARNTSVHESSFVEACPTQDAPPWEVRGG